ncbi:indolepyruvate oxidoreductase subunit B [Pyrococcus sp. ST04]|nr:indolepyruvate oxidoreductase subunit B [Pyrococcus sp. ST04]
MSQRYGSVLSYMRFGENVYSPLIEEGKANLMLALEPVEALRNARFLGKQSYAIINAYPIHTATTLVGKERYPSLDEIKEAIGKICSVDMMNFQKEADKINPRTLGVVMLGYAYGKGLVPLKKESIVEGIKLTLREKLWDINFKALERGIELAKS